MRTALTLRAALLPLAISIAMLLPAQEKSADANQGSLGRRDVTIGANDAVNIFVPEDDEITKTWRVGPEGELSLPLVGRILAAGKTVDQFERDLADRLKAYIRDPQVHVSVVNQQSQPVTVLGAVGTPGPIQLEGRKTLLDVLMSVGGPKDPGPTVTITRKMEFGRIPLREAHDEENGKFSVADLSVDDVMSARSTASSLIIQPYDVISVSAKEQQGQRIVHIIGEVQKPGAVELVLQKSVSVMQALAAAGGPTRTASLGKTVIIHVNPDGLRTEVAAIDLRKIIGGKVKDLELIAGDILVVPSSNFKTYTELAAKSAVGGGSGLLLARF